MAWDPAVVSVLSKSRGVLEKFGGGGAGSVALASATLVGGYPLTITQAPAVDLTNQDCTVVSDGVTPIEIFAQTALQNSGATIAHVVLSVREGATVYLSSGPQDVAVTTGFSIITLADAIILPAGSHTLKLTAHKSNANGVVTAQTNTGDLSDTFLTAVMLAGAGVATPAAWTPVSGGAGMVWQGADNAPHILPGLDVTDVMYSRQVGGKIVGQTYDRAGIRGAIPSAVAWVSGWTAGGVFLCEESVTIANVYSWIATAANWTGATNPVCKVGIYGPITIANAAVVPLLLGSAHTTTAVTTAGYARSSGWSLAQAIVRGNLYCLMLHMSWTVAPTTIPNFYIHNNSGALSGNNDPAQGAANLGTIALTSLITGLTDLPATIDLSNTRTVGAAVRLPLLIAASA